MTIVITAKTKARTKNHPNVVALRGFARNKKIDQRDRAATLLYLGEIGYALFVYNEQRLRSGPDIEAAKRLLLKHRGNTPGYTLKGVLRCMRTHKMFKDDSQELTLSYLRKRIALIIKSRFTRGIRQDVQLYEHQERAVEAVAKNRRMILNHGTGTGKTLSAIAAFERLKSEGNVEKMLAVVPTSLRSNFSEKGVRKFTNYKVVVFGNMSEVSRKVAHGLKDFPRDADIYIVGYEMFTKRPKDYILKTGVQMVVYDEFHRIKGGTTQVAQAVKETAHNHKYMIGMTASLVSNRPEELLPLIEAIAMGQHELGETQKQFRRKFFKHKRTLFGLGSKTKVIEGLKNKQKLGKEMRKFVHFVESLDATQMPKKVVQEVRVQMSPHQERLYRYILRQMDPKLVRKLRQGTNNLTEEDIRKIYHKFWQARFVSNSVHAVDKSVSAERSAEITPKIKKMLNDVQDHIQSHPDPRVMIYTNLVKAEEGTLEVVAAGLDKRKIKYGIFAGVGVTKVPEREKAAQDYLLGKKRVIIVTSAGSEGLSLNNTTMICMLDGHFNPEKIRQAEARGIRAGDQKHLAPNERKVIVKRYTSTLPKRFFGLVKETSIDEMIYEIAKRKDILNDELRALLEEGR